MHRVPHSSNTATQNETPMTDRRTQTDRRRVRCTSPSTPAKRRLLQTVVFTTVRLAQPLWFSETLFLRVSQNFPSVLRRTLTTDRCLHDGPSCTTVLVVRDPVSKGLSKFSKCPTKDRHTHDGPSCTTVMIVRDFPNKGLPTFSNCSTMDSYEGLLYQ